MPAKKRTKKVKAEQGELIQKDDKPQWTVVTGDDGVHRLMFGKRRLNKGTTEADLRLFRTTAEWGNKREMVPPKKKILCKADRTLPAPPKRGQTEAPAEAAADNITPFTPEA